MNNYLIPANSKKGQLWFNVFRPIDMGILGAGAFATLILAIAIPSHGLMVTVVKLLPLAICLLLVLPLPYYHNVLVFLQEAIIYWQSQKEYPWKGWCVKDVIEK